MTSAGLAVLEVAVDIFGDIWCNQGLVAMGRPHEQQLPVPAQMSVHEQFALTACQAVEALRSGRLSAEAYAATLIARAESLASLNSLIALNKAGALAAARKIDALRAAAAHFRRWPACRSS